MTPLSRARRRWLIAIAIYVVVLLTVNHLPFSKEVSDIFARVDKLGHFSVYFLLTFLCVMVPLGNWRQRALIVVLILLPFSALDEWAQVWVRTRTAHWRDWAANCVGIGGGLVFGAWLAARRERSYRSPQPQREGKGTRDDPNRIEAT